MPDAMKVDCAFKAGTLVAEVAFVHCTPVDYRKCPTSYSENILCVTRLYELLLSLVQTSKFALGVLPMTAPK
ncbi:hypothetical protein F0170_04210 [Pseudomonas sp. MAFF 730085]|uniref:Uncharacterized protein n=1 Tax=Pseudomonas kitaguniensis TaxID=2607908 RepID=A0A5N7JPM2_9PSED|nr:hypothetical protein [Pseudomonas kitaguniensis]MPR02655.1 hypothetical protein [Pseudomonas kitaguniensis]